MKDIYLAFDLGAESGRGLVAEFDGNRLALTEAGRFPTTRDSKDPGPDGVWRWDYAKILGELRSILAQAESRQKLSGVAVDTWGVDFGLLDEKGALIEEPVCYRDDSHPAAMKDTLSRWTMEEIWNATGIQFMPFNTLFQLRAAQARNPSVLERASRLLFMPDLLASGLLAGPVAVSELTIASTSQMLDPNSCDWNRGLLERLGVPTHFLQPIVEPGTQYGLTSGGTVVRAAAGHDTACAVAAAPAEPGAKWAFLSSGTWSLLGVERREPALSADALRMGLSNEIGVLRTTRLLKNIMGLWLVQECRRSLARAGQDLSYAELTALAASAPDNGPLIDAADARFLAPADMPSEIRAACAETGQTPPGDAGTLIRCCLDSLALAYRRTLSALETVVGDKYDVLHIVGGGTKNTLLNQLTADATGLAVVAGPAEATAVGNVLAQMVGRGVLASYDEARQVVRNSFQPETFHPRPGEAARWAERDSRFEAAL